MRQKIKIKVNGKTVTYVVSLGADKGDVYYLFAPATSVDLSILQEMNIEENGAFHVKQYLDNKGVKTRRNNGYSGHGLMFVIEDESIEKMLMKPIL